MTAEELREQFRKETEIKNKFCIGYIYWLESKLIAVLNMKNILDLTNIKANIKKTEELS